MKVGRGCDFLACINNTDWLLCVWAFWRSLRCPDASSEPHATKTQAPVVMTTIWQVLKKNIRYWLFDVKRQIKFVFSHRCARSVLLHLVFYERGQMGLKSILSEFNMPCFFTAETALCWQNTFHYLESSNTDVDALCKIISIPTYIFLSLECQESSKLA